MKIVSATEDHDVHFHRVHLADHGRVRTRQRCESGMSARGLDRDRRSMEQLDYELGVIGRLRYEPYFLAVAQVVADVRDMGIRVAARGSGAGSMVNHALFVATANPLEPRLLFERFLSERRSSLPDIDIDVESACRMKARRQCTRYCGAALRPICSSVS